MNKIKRQFIIILFLASLTFSYLFAQNKNDYVVKGRLEGLKNDTWLYLIHNIDSTGRPDTLSRTRANGEQFTFKGEIPLEGEVFFIKIDTFKTKYQREIKGYIVFLLENKPIQIKGSVYSLDLSNIAISGSTTHDEYLEFKAHLDSLVKVWNESEQELAFKSGKADSANLAILTEKDNKDKNGIHQYQQDWIESHPNSLMSPWWIDICFKRLADKKRQYNNLSARAKNSFFGVALNREMKIAEKRDMGQLAPEFAFYTTDSQLLALRTVVAESKVTLVDFWASWCAPCRAKFPNMKKWYALYHSKGLNILGYSVDQGIDQWKTAVANDSLPWYNVRDTTNYFTEKMYGISTVPTILLLDQNGRIIANDEFSDEDIEKKLSEIFDK